MRLRTPRPDVARAGVRRQSLSVGLATGLYGVSFGALSAAGGLSLAQTCVLSLVMFSGGSQFALVGVLAPGGGILAAVSGAGLLGVRNALYAVQLSSLLSPSPRSLLPTAQVTIDESTAVALATRARHPGRPELARLGFWATGTAIYLCWNAATLAGALAGSQLADPGRFGLDGAAAGAFLALVWPRLDARDVRLVAGLAVVVALAVLPLVPAGIPVLVAALVATAAGSLRRGGTARA